MLFAETTTLGVRSYEVERRALEREIVRVETQYGPIDVKVARLNGHVVNEMPEYEQCRARRRRARVPLRVVEERRAIGLRVTKSPTGDTNRISNGLKVGREVLNGHKVFGR